MQTDQNQSFVFSFAGVGGRIALKAVGFAVVVCHHLGSDSLLKTPFLIQLLSDFVNRLLRQVQNRLAWFGTRFVLKPLHTRRLRSISHELLGDIRKLDTTTGQS